MGRRRIAMLLAGLCAIFGMGLLSASTAAAAPGSDRSSSEISTVSHQMSQQNSVHPLACGFSQVWTYTTINWAGLWPCDGVYINCWEFQSGTLEDWVSWTSRYGYGQQGWVNDYAINTNNSTTSTWPHC